MYPAFGCTLATSRWVLRCSGRDLLGGVQPNKRLKLAGADRFKGNGVLCPWRGTDFVPRPCAGGRVARSLSAIRWKAVAVGERAQSVPRHAADATAIVAETGSLAHTASTVWL